MKKKIRNHCFIVGMGRDDRYYQINGMWYIVSSRFAPTNSTGKGEETLSDKLGKFIRSDFADLTVEQDEATLDGEYACSAAGEGDL